MGILRLAHVEVGVEDLELCTAYYVEVLGLMEVRREPGRVYLKCWDEHDHHSVILKEVSQRSFEHLGFKVEAESDLDDLEKLARSQGLLCEGIAEGEEPGQGEALRIKAPTGHSVELIPRMERTGSVLPATNPPPKPLGFSGIYPLRLDHVCLTAENVDEAVAFFVNILGFRLTERVIADNGHILAAWLERSHMPCDLAVLSGPNSGLGYFAFRLEDYADVVRAADVLACYGIPIEAGPLRSGATRAQVIHFLDPAGNGNAVFAGGRYWVDPDAEPITWTEEEIGRAFFYPQPTLYDRFLKAQKV